MEYNRLGKAGIKVSELSLGSWLTFSEDLKQDQVSASVKVAFDRGINFFDTAEAYANGQAEVLLGNAIRDYKREDLVVSTKIFWGGKGPNDNGLSWKHLVEGTRNSLRRLQLDYIDLLFCHRPDPNTPLEETIRAMDLIVRAGWAFYWGTSEWPATLIEEAFRLCKEMNCIPPTMEQPQYHMFARERVEVEYKPLYTKYGLGTTIWSPLNSGLLSGKYVDGIPAGSRLAKVDWLKRELTPEKTAKIKKLQEVARSLDCSLSQLALAWCLKNPNVSTVILGVSRVEQLVENIDALKVKNQLEPAVIAQIEAILK